MTSSGPDADRTDVHRRLDSWARMLAAYLRVQAELESSDEGWFAGPQQLLLPMSAILLYTASDDAMSPATLAMGAFLATMEDDEPDPMLLLTLPEEVGRWTEILQIWAATGVVALVDDPEGGCDEAASLEPLFDEIEALLPDAAALLGPVRDSLRSGPMITVTGFGRDQLGRVLRGQGLPVPAVGDLVDAAPSQFLQALSGHRPEQAGDEIRIWLDARGEQWPGALRELVMSASGKDDEAPLRRMALPLVIALVSEAAQSMIEEWRQDPWLAVPVGLGLAAATRAAQPPPGHLLWMAVDSLSTGLDDDDTFADIVQQIGVADLLAEPGALAVAVGLDHPRTREVLRLLVEHLDDRKLAQQLRRSLAANKPRRARG